jgi:branched-chain amino acid transport system permease protein
LDEGIRIALVAISYALILFLIASGLSLVMGIMGVVNMAHGSLYMLGAYVGLSLADRLSNFWAGAFLAGLLVGIFGLLLERLCLNRLYRQHNEQMLLTLGFVFILGNVVLWVWGGYAYMGKLPGFLADTILIGELTFPIYRLALILIGLVLAAALWWLQEKTRAGAILRAGMDDKNMTMALGIDYGLVCSVIFFLGVFIAAFTGYIGTPLMGAQAEMGWPILLLSLSVVVVGGVGRVEGTLLGAIIVGCLDSLGKTFFPNFSQFTIYLIFVLTIMIRPAGILGRKQNER